MLSPGRSGLDRDAIVGKRSCPPLPNGDWNSGRSSALSERSTRGSEGANSDLPAKEIHPAQQGGSSCRFCHNRGGLMFGLTISTVLYFRTESERRDVEQARAEEAAERHNAETNLASARGAIDHPHANRPGSIGQSTRCNRYSSRYARRRSAVLGGTPQ